MRRAGRAASLSRSAGRRSEACAGGEARRRRRADRARQRLARTADAAGAGVRRAGRRRGDVAVRVRGVPDRHAGRRRDAARRAGAAARRTRCRAATTSMRSLAAIAPATRLVYLANPNNPTGTWFARDAFAGFIARVPRDVLVVVDEAYAEVADAPDFASRCRCSAHIRTWSSPAPSARPMRWPGLRVGYAIAHPGLVAVLERVRESFNVNTVALAAAEAALGDEDAPARDRWRATPSSARCWRRHCANAAGACSPSQTNFLLVDFGARRARHRSRPAGARRGAAADGRLRLAANACASASATPAKTSACSRRWTGSLHERWHRHGLDRIARRRRCSGELTVPGDKSVSHRAVMLAALADGTSRIDGFLEGEDTRATAAIFAQLGVRIEAPSPSRADRARRRRRWPACAVDAPLDCGNAGTGMRLLAGLLAGAAVRQRAGRRCVAVATADAARDRSVGADGRADRCGGRRTAAAAHPRRAATARHRFRVRSRQRAGQVGGAARRPVCRGRDDRARAASDPRLHRAHAGGVRLADRFRAGHARAARRPAPARDRRRGAGGFFVRGVLHRRRDAGAGLRIAPARGGHESAPHRPAARVARDGRRHPRGTSRAATAANRSPISSCAMRRCAASRCRSSSCRT